MARADQNQVILYSVFVIVIALILAPSLSITGKAVAVSTSGEYGEGKYLVILNDHPILEQRAKLDTALEALKAREQAAAGNPIKVIFIKADNAIKKRIITNVRDSYTTKVEKSHAQFKKELERKGIDVTIAQEFQYESNGFLVEGLTEEIDKLTAVPTVSEVVSYEEVKTEPEKAPYTEFFQPSAQEVEIQYQMTADNQSLVKLCSDGTLAGQCTTVSGKPYVCVNGNYYQVNCTKCGCSRGEYCNTENSLCVWVGKCTDSDLSRQPELINGTYYPGLIGDYPEELVSGICQDQGYMGSTWSYDYCLMDGNTLDEYYCKDTYGTSGQLIRIGCASRKYTCPNGCHFGACDSSILKCSDGTPYGECSKSPYGTKPLFCENGILINKCSTCGCVTDRERCVPDETCRQIDKSYTCTDSDDLNPNVKGNVGGLSNGVPYTMYDSCSSSAKQVYEYFCWDKIINNLSVEKVSGVKVYDCLYTCSDGACLSTPTTPTTPVNQTTPPITYWRDDFNDLSSWVKTGTDTMEVTRDGLVHILTTSNRAQLTTNNKMAGLDVTKDYIIKTRAIITKTSHWLFYIYNKHVNLVYDYGSMICRYGGTNTQVMNLNIGQWYEIEARVHPSTNKYDVYVDGVFKKTCSMPTDRTTYEFLIGDFETGTLNYGEIYFDYYEVSTGVTTTSPTTQTCSDGTASGTCNSISKPNYCSNGNIVANCQKCGCIAGQTCQSNGVCLGQPLNNTCTDGTPNGQCSLTMAKPYVCMNGNLLFDCTKCGCPSDKPTCVADGACHSGSPLVCTDSDGGDKPDIKGKVVTTEWEYTLDFTDYCDSMGRLVEYSCSSGVNPANFCNEKTCQKFYTCPYGCLDGACKSASSIPPANQTTYTCSDGTTLLTCSKITNPYYCTSSKTLVQDCNKCPCPDSAPFCNTATGVCYYTIPPVQKCSDGTPYGNCSATKPLYCENGNLVSKCTKCGCSSGLTCKVADGTCIVPEPTPTPTPTEPPATNLYWRDEFNDLNSWVKTGTDTMEVIDGQAHILTSSNRAQLTTNNKMSGLDTTKDYTIKTRAKIAKTSHWLFFIYNKHVNLVYDYTTLSCRYGNTNTQIMPITIGQWYDIQAIVHPSTNNYDVYVNGVFKKTCSMPTDRTTYEFLIGDFETGTANYGEMYFDYFEVSQ